METQILVGWSAGVLARCEYVWRVLATGFCYSLFGLGGISLAVTFVPLLWLLPGDERRHRVAQYLVSRMFRIFLWIVDVLGVGKVTVCGGNMLREPGARLVMANHPTLLDVVVLISRLPQADCVVKEGVRNNPFMRGIVRTTGYISNAPPGMLVAECSRVLSEGRTLIVFPEGTRSRPGKEMIFQRGAARIALRSRVPMQLVTITCEPPALMKNTKWYQVPSRRWHIRMRVHEPECVADMVDTELPDPIAAKRCTDALKNSFERKLKQHAEIPGRNS